MRSAVQLRVVREAPTPERSARQGARDGSGLPDTGDLALLALLFLLNLLPVAGAVSGIGHWSEGIVGFAAGAMLLTGRELWSQLRARAGAKTRCPGEP
jgi:hypothetical protein